MFCYNNNKPNEEFDNFGHGQLCQIMSILTIANYVKNGQLLFLKITKKSSNSVPVSVQWCDVHEKPYSSLCRKNFKQFLLHCL